MAKLGFTLGENIGEILLDIAQNKITEGKGEEALKDFELNFEGFTRDYALQVLKNQVVIKSEGVGITLSDDKADIEKNEDNIRDWKHIVKHNIDDLQLIMANLRDHYDHLMHVGVNPYDFEIKKLASDWEGVPNILAHVLSGNPFPNLNSSGEALVHKIITQCEENIDEQSTEHRIFYRLSRFVDNIRLLHKDYMKFCEMYDFLVDNEFIQRTPKIEVIIENILKWLNDFSDDTKGYHHPMCDPEIHQLKEKIYDDMLSTHWGKEYLKYGILRHNIEDGYDAGYLSPDGIFFGADGDINDLLHIQISDALFESKYVDSNFPKYKKLDREQYLMEGGWMKIHHDCVYGYFRDLKNENSKRLYCPTDEQVDVICRYGKSIGGTLCKGKELAAFDPDKLEYKTVSQIRQMDEIALHNFFNSL